jgi:hypothetical protein
MRASVAVTSLSVLALLALPACDAPGGDGAEAEGAAEPDRPAAGARDAGSDGEAAGAEQDADARAVEETVRALFDAMREADSASVRGLFHPDARLSGPVERGGEVLLRSSSAASFADAVGGAEQTWDERISGLEVRVDGRLATAWMDYVFYLGDELSHCGVNAVQLYRSDDGWKIFQIADTRRREGCPDPRGEG